MNIPFFLVYGGNLIYFTFFIFLISYKYLLRNLSKRKLIMSWYVFQKSISGQIYTDGQMPMYLQKRWERWFCSIWKVMYLWSSHALLQYSALTLNHSPVGLKVWGMCFETDLNTHFGVYRVGKKRDRKEKKRNTNMIKNDR